MIPGGGGTGQEIMGKPTMESILIMCYIDSHSSNGETTLTCPHVENTLDHLPCEETGTMFRAVKLRKEPNVRSPTIFTHGH